MFYVKYRPSFSLFLSVSSVVFSFFFLFLFLYKFWMWYLDRKSPNSFFLSLPLCFLFFHFFILFFYLNFPLIQGRNGAGGDVHNLGLVKDIHRQYVLFALLPCIRDLNIYMYNVYMYIFIYYLYKVNMYILSRGVYAVFHSVCRIKSSAIIGDPLIKLKFTRESQIIIRPSLVEF